MRIESALKFQFEICAYVDTCVISNSRIAHVKKTTFRNYVILRNCGTIKLQPTELGYMLNLMSQSNCIYHLPYLSYYSLKFQFCKIDFSRKSADHVISFFWSLIRFWIANLMIESKFRNPNFLKFIEIKFETNYCPSPCSNMKIVSDVLSVFVRVWF